MTKYHIRNYLQLFHILIYKNVGFNQLKSLFHISANTLKKDLIILKTIAEFYGVKLLINEQTITYKVVDNSLFLKIINECSDFYNKNIRRPRNLILRASYIANCLINSLSPISIEDIASSLGYSRSNLRNDMKFIRDVFSSYSLKIIGVPYSGIVIKGSELSKRYALTAINLRCNTTILTDATTDLTNYVENRKTYLEIRTIIDHVLDDNYFAFSFSEKRRLAEYIIIQKERIKLNNYIDQIDNQAILDLVESKEFYIANTIYSNLNIKFDNYEIYETLSLTVLLIVSREFSLSNLNNKKDCDLLSSEICDYLKSTWCIDLSNGLWYDALYVWTMNIVTKHQFNLLATYQYPYFGLFQKYYDYPIIAKISYEINYILSKKYAINIHRTQIYDISNIIGLYLEDIPFDYKLPRIGISHSLNQLFNQLQFQHINKLLKNNTYKEIETINLNNIYSDIYLKYDIIISDTNLIIPHQTKPKVININDHLFSEKELINTVIDNCSIINDILFDEIIVIDLQNYDYESVVNKMLSLLDKYTNPTEKERMNISDRIHRIYDYKGSMHYVHYNQTPRRNILIMAKIGDNCKYREMSIDRMFIVILDITPQRLKYYNYVTALLATNGDIFKQVYQNPTNDFIFKIVDDRVDLKYIIK